MTINVYDNVQWKIPKAIYVWNANANVWSETSSVSIWANGRWQTIHNTAVINSNVTNANLFSILGEPNVALNAKVTVNTNVWVTSVNANIASFDISLFPTGSRIYLVNKGTIQGAEGNAGWPGGNAVSTTSTLIINNTGTIAGGAANTVSNTAGVGYYLSGSSLTSYETGGILTGLVE